MAWKPGTRAKAGRATLITEGLDTQEFIASLRSHVPLNDKLLKEARGGRVEGGRVPGVLFHIEGEVIT